jgi:peptidoglycan/LPS O-acetylase OafA/YrhL
VAVLLVLSVHLGDNILLGSWKWLCGSGGVTIFFVLSGYLITMLALREEEDRGELCLRAFFVRRTFRIFPLYYYVIGLGGLLILTSGSQQGRTVFGAALPYYLAYMGEFAPTAHFYHSWSLGIEEKFYLLWPVLAFVLLRGRPGPRLALAGALALAAPITPGLRQWIHWTDYSQIAWGCAVALALHDPRLYRRLAPLARGPGLYLGLAALLATHFASGHAYLKDEHPAEALYALAISWALIGISIGRPIWNRALELEAVRWIGRRAYGVYLVHVGCIWVVEILLRPGAGGPLRMAATYLAAAALSLGVAEILFRVVERPMTLVGRRISERMLSGPEAAPAALRPQPSARAAGAS